MKIKNFLKLDVIYPNVHPDFVDNPKVIWCLENPNEESSKSQICNMMDKIHKRGGKKGKDYILTLGRWEKKENYMIWGVHPDNAEGIALITTTDWISPYDDYIHLDKRNWIK